MSGYDHDFVDDPPDRLLCNICHLPCRDPYRSVCCGHAFCKSELEEGGCPWPECRNKDFSTYVDKALEREIKALRSYCPNKKDGCGWIGEIARVDNHLGGCKISCSKCKQIVYFSTMKSHLDTKCPCYCPYCDITAEREVINSEHKEKCHKFPLTCPNNCGLDDIPRDNMDEHKKVCPLEIIQCEYSCGAVITRNEVTEHNRGNFIRHVYTFKDELDRSIHNATNVLKHYAKVEEKIASLLSSVTQELDSFEVKFKAADTVNNATPQHSQLSQPDDHNSFDYVSKLCQNFVLKAFHVLFFLQLVCSLLLYFTQTIAPYWQYNEGDVHYPLLTEMDERLSISLIGLIKCGLIEEPPPDCNMECEIEHWRSVLGIVVIAPVTLEMPDFDKYRTHNEVWYSRPFFAYEGGYVVCLRVFAAGNDDGKGTHVSVYLHLMKGPYDDKLKWPMRAKYAINLIDPTNNTKYHSCNPYFKDVSFSEVYTAYKRITNDRRMSYYGMGYPQYINIDIHSTSNTMLSNMTVASSFLTKRNSLLFQISYYDNTVGP